MNFRIKAGFCYQLVNKKVTSIGSVYPLSHNSFATNFTVIDVCICM